MCVSPIFLRGLYVPCGKCYECRNSKAIEWSYRICDEVGLYESPSCMVTLTYNDVHLPPDRSLVRSDLSAFIKRLRDRVAPTRLRFFACGEYGALHDRPHFHIIIFGWHPNDLQFFRKDKDGYDLFLSPLIFSCWSRRKKVVIAGKKKSVRDSFGFHSVVKGIDQRVALYVSLYFQKSRKSYPGRVAPFRLMSRNPGIGFGAVNPRSLDSDRIYRDGRSIPIPRYYCSVLSRLSVGFDNAVKLIRSKRLARLRRKSSFFPEFFDFQLHLNSKKIIMKKNPILFFKK